MIHHTGDYTSEDGMVDLLWDGYEGLPGPLSLAGITKDGSVHLTGYGRCNHAGTGDPAVLQHVIDEKYPLPKPRFANGQQGGVDGNRHFYGFELVNRGDGRDPWTVAQIGAAQAAAAAICLKHGWTERSIIGHLEWQRGKSDPFGFRMDEFRRGAGDLMRMWRAA